LRFFPALQRLRLGGPANKELLLRLHLSQPEKSDDVSSQPQRKRAIAAAIPIKGNRQNFMGEVLNDLLTPDTRKLDFSPMRLGVEKTARELAKSPDHPASVCRAFILRAKPCHSR
jgi:hypothetical protein